MWIKREFQENWAISSSLPVRILRGVRQCGKSSLLVELASPLRKFVSLDDLQIRQIAESDPALFFEQHPWPVILDEVQYAPQLFPEIKLRIDRQRREARLGKVSEKSPRRTLEEEDPVWMTGSNQILLDHQIRETLAGRAEYMNLHTLSVAELSRHYGERFSLREYFIRGGWPELYVRPELDPIRYLNDYIQTFIEKDIVLSAGIQKLRQFHQSLGLLAARTACMLNASEVASVCGVTSATLQEWISALERNLVVHLLPGYFTNLNKRLIKTPKLYFLDVGLASRLQAWSSHEPLLLSPQAGLLFETLVIGEIVRARDHHRKNWNLHFWRTKEGEEVDFLVQQGNETPIALDAKLGIQNVAPIGIPKGLRKLFPKISEVALVTYGGELRKLSSECVQVPIHLLGQYLLERLEG